VEAILKPSPPKTKRHLRHFLGMINYYRDMWQKRSHMLAPLTGVVSSLLVKYKWGEEQQKAFEEIKQKVSQETLLAFPDFEKNFMYILMPPTCNWEQS
jgi:cbb3-type cytochrome oxidase cytochrome c subunit